VKCFSAFFYAHKAHDPVFSVSVQLDFTTVNMWRVKSASQPI